MKQSHRSALLFAEAAPTREGDAVTGFSGVAYSGGVVPNYGWRGDMAIDLSSMQAPPARVPITFGHNDDDVGQTVGYASVINDGGRLALTDGHFSDATPAGKTVAALMAEGQPFMFSVGVNGRSFETDRNKPTKLNGRDMNVDTVMRNARLLHVSFVHAGADPNAHAARLSARMAQQPEENTTMDNDQAARVTELEAKVAALTASNATLTTERDTARGELETLRAGARNAAITALFGAGHGMTDAQLKPYRDMNDEQFEAVRVALAARGGADPALFAQGATQGRDPDAGAVDAEFHAPAGYSVDPASAALHAKAVKYQAEHKETDYLAALKAVSTGA